MGKNEESSHKKIMGNPFVSRDATSEIDVIFEPIHLPPSRHELAILSKAEAIL